jgi:MFS family permease
MPSGQTIDKQTLRWRNAVVLIFFLSGLNLATWASRLPAVRSSLNVDVGVIGLLATLSTVGAVVGLSSAPPILARLGPRRGILFTLWLTALGMLIIGVGVGALHDLPLVAIGLTTIGFGGGAVDVMMNVEGAAAQRALGKTVLPFMHASWSAGGVLGSAAGALAAGLGIEPQWQFFGEAVVVAVGVVIATRFLAPTIPENLMARDPVSFGRRVRTWINGWGDRTLLLIGLIVLGTGLAEGSASNWMTLAVKEDHHQSASVAALFYSAFAACMMVSRIVGGKLTDRIGQVAAVRLTTAIGVAGVVVFVFAGPIWAVLAGALMWAFGASLGFPLGMVAAAESGPKSAARVSMVATIGYFANLAGPPVIGFLGQRYTLLMALLLVAALLAVSFFASPAMRPARVPGNADA